MDFVVVGNQKKQTDRTIAARGAATVETQNTIGQAVAVWGKIQGVYRGLAEATGGPHSGGKKETGVDRRLS